MLNRYKFADQEVNFILEKEDELLKNAGGAIEDIVPFIRYFYKSKAFKAMEEFSSEVLDGYLGKKYDEARKTFDRSKMTISFILRFVCCIKFYVSDVKF